MSTYAMAQLTAKMKNVDHDLRFMALSDLTTEANKGNLNLDANTEDALVAQVLALMSDSNTEVKNQAVKAIGALVKRITEKKLFFVVDSIAGYSVAPKDDQLRDIANLGLRTVIRELSPSAETAQAAVSRLIPKLITQIETASGSTTLANQDTLLNAVELLTDVFARFEVCVTSDFQTQAKTALIPLLTNSRPAIRKRTVDALAQLIAIAPTDNSEACASLISTVVHPTLAGKGKVDVLTAVSLVGALAARAPNKLGPVVDQKEMIPKMMSATRAESGSNGDADAEMADDDSSDDGAQLAQQAETREGVLQALERLILRCPKEMAPHASAVLDLACSLIAWDPNYAGGDDDDNDVAMADEDDDEDFGDDYSDDDDVSWKVRRAATRTICAVAETRPEMLSTICKKTVPLLVSRFSEREESVRLEIWATFASLLDVVGILDGVVASTAHLAHSHTPLGMTPSRPAREGTPNALKRKRGADDTPMATTPQTTEESPISLLRGQSTLISKAIIKQITSKSLASCQAAFNLLDALVLVLQGGLEDQMPSLLVKIENALTSSTQINIDSSTGSATSLKLAALTLLSDIFATHPLTCFTPSLDSLLPALIACASGNHNKTSSAAFRTMSALLKALRIGDTLDKDAQSSVRAILDAATSRLSVAGADSEVRESAVNTLGDILASAGDALGDQLPTALNLLDEALRKEVTRIVAVRTLAKVAASPILTADGVFAEWAAEETSELAGFLQQSNRILRVETFVCLPLLIQAAVPSLTADSVSSLTEAIAPSVTSPDLVLLPHAISSIENLVKAQPEVVSKDKTFKKTIMPAVYTLLDTPQAQSGAPFEALLAFFGALAASGVDTTPLITELKKTTPKAGPRCIGAIVSQKPDVADQIAADFVANLKSSKISAEKTIFSLHALGEIGRVEGYTGSVAAFELANSKIASETEEVRSAAAYALGNLAVGAPQLVDEIIAEVASAQADDKKRSLFLHALKEFITHADPAALAKVAESLWTPLFNLCAVDGPAPTEPATAADSTPDAKKAREKRVEQKFKESEALRQAWLQTETSRNIAAECLGKIALTDPRQYLNQLQTRLQDSLAGIRAAIISTIRFTFTDNSAAFDEALDPSLVAFLSLMSDPNLDVRRSALAAFNAAAHHKAHLLRRHLPALLPMLYQQTVVNPDLVRIVEMGPFKHKVDDGLEVRKAAYETCFTLLDTCFARLDTYELLDAVLRGINDDHEIRAICYLMIVRLSQVAPVAVTQKLDSAADAFTSLFNEKLKDTAVKQEQEKLQQMQLAAMRAVAVLNRLATPANTPKFCKTVAALKTSAFKEQFAEMLTEPSHGANDMDLS